MIELPEAMTLASQMNEALAGRRITECMRGNAPHKFAFYNHEADEYAALLQGKTIGASTSRANFILTSIDPGLTLYLGGGGERILLHTSAATLPKKHQFLLRFEDGASLTVTIQMWGCIQVTEQGEPPTLGCFSQAPSPISDDFTLDYFKSLFKELEPTDPRSVKYFLISKPGIPGIGNGYTQDILFRARLAHRHLARALYDDQKEALYEAIRETLFSAVALGGRDSELDLYGCPGRYPRLLDSKSVGQPCPECGTKIVKENYLGGASYYCPKCQE